MRKPAVSGNAHDYQVWPQSVNGISGSWVSPCGAGLNSCQSVRTSANSKINFWQTKLLAGKKLTDESKSSLGAWLDYMDKLKALDFTDVKYEAGFKEI